MNGIRGKREESTRRIYTMCRGKNLPDFINDGLEWRQVQVAPTVTVRENREDRMSSRTGYRCSLPISSRETRDVEF